MAFAQVVVGAMVGFSLSGWLMARASGHRGIRALGLGTVAIVVFFGALICLAAIGY